MEKRTLKISWNKSGAGSDSTRLFLPVSWVRDMGIDKKNNKVSVVYNADKKNITIKKL